MGILRSIAIGVLVLVVLLIIVMSYRLYSIGKQSQDMRPQLGIEGGRLTACPKSPNCVCSFTKASAESNSEQEATGEHEQDDMHYIDPIVGGKDAFAFLSAYLMNQENVNIVSQSDIYLHATFTSQLFNFVDDLELYLKDDTLHVRSASRVGHSDLGQNRKRVEKLRTLVGEQM